MANPERMRQLAIETMRRNPEIKTKINALDALDRLALNPSGWFSDGVLDNLTLARKKILVNHWPEALESLEAVRNSMAEFVHVIKQDAERADQVGVMERANDEITHCAQVLSWIDHQPPFL